MEADVKIHNQAPGQVPGIQSKRGRRENMSKGGQDHDGYEEILQSQLNLGHGNLWTLERKLRSLYGTKLGPPYVWDSGEAWASDVLAVGPGVWPSLLVPIHYGMMPYSAVLQKKGLVLPT